MGGCIGLGQGEVFNWEEMERKRNERFQTTLAEYKSRNKSLSDLIFSKKFLVESVIGENKSTSFTPESEVMFGGRSPVYNTGFTSKLILEVKDYSSEYKTGIERIVFNGDLPVTSGSVILAKIPRSESEVLKNPSQYSCDKHVFLFDRTYNSEEIAIEISLLDVSGKILRVQRGVDYSRYKDHIK